MTVKKPTYDELQQRVQTLELESETLRKSEERYKFAIDAAESGLWEFDPRTEAAYFSPRWVKMLGYSPGELPASYQTWADLVHPDDRPPAEAALKNFLKYPEGLLSQQFRMGTKSDKWRWIHSQGKAFEQDSEGNVSRMVGIHTDITERREMGASLRTTQFIFDRASIGIYRIGSDARIIDVNRQAALNLGYSMEELCSLTIFDIDPFTNSENWESVWQSLCDGGVDTFETVHKRKDGTEIPVQITSNLLEYEDEQFSVAFVQDITEAKERETELKASEIRFRRLFHEAPLGYVITDIHGNEPYIKDVNTSFIDLLGYSREELLDTPLSKYYTEDSKRRLLKGGFQRALTGEFFSEERDLITRDNRVIHTILHTSREFDANHTVVGTRAMYIDITDRKKAEKESKRLETALLQAQKLEAIGTLAGGIAHDFNNILGAIVGYAQLAQLVTRENPKAEEYIDQVCTASERAKGLVQQILAFSRQSELEKQPVDIGLIIKEALKLIRASIPVTIEIQQDVKSDIGIVQANQTHIHQIVMNLCTNAYHAMENEGGILTVELVPTKISTRDSNNFQNVHPGHYLRLTVSDTGHGMDSETCSRIFEPYFTTKEVGEGTGLGLSTVHGIVNDHGGDIKVYSEVGIGTTFNIFFPVIEGTAKDTRMEPDNFPRGNEQLLFVDDEIALVNIGKELLENLGYRVETRTSANDAFEAFRAQPDKYDIIITDMAMPKMDGEKLVKRIKSINPDVPIILCTGFSKRMSAENAKRLGIHSMIMKPLTLNDLANTVREVLDESSPPEKTWNPHSAFRP